MGNKAASGVPRFVILPVLLVVLGGLLAWRVRIQEQRRHGPTGGSTTVEGTETVVASKIPGRLIDLGVREGDRVKAGQVIGHLECSEQEAQLRAAQARVESAGAQQQVAAAAAQQARRAAHVTEEQVAAARAQEQVLAVDQERAQKDLTRSTRLQAAGAVSQALYDNDVLRSKNLERQRDLVRANERTAMASTAASLAAVRTAEVQILAAEAQLKAARAELQRAQLAVDECQLVAPRAGDVTARLHEPGAVVPAAARVVTVLDLSIVKALFFVPDAELGRVQLGAPAELRVDAFPQRVWQGRVRRIASEAEFTPRDVQTREDRDRLVYAVEIEIDNRDGALRAGMPGDIALPGTGR